MAGFMEAIAGQKLGLAGHRGAFSAAPQLSGSFFY